MVVRINKSVLAFNNRYQIFKYSFMVYACTMVNNVCANEVIVMHIITVCYFNTVENYNSLIT